MSNDTVCGYIDRIDAAGIAGWLCDLNAPDTPLTVAVMIDDVTVDVVTCTALRRDVAAAGFPSKSVGFFVEMPAWCADGQEHTLDLRRADGEPLGRSDLCVEGSEVVPLDRGTWTTRFSVIAPPKSKRARAAASAANKEFLRSLFQQAANKADAQSGADAQAAPIADPGGAAALIAASGAFLADWYVASYPDVAASGLDPLTHYVRQGCKQRKRPNPYFDPEWYVQTNPAASAYEDPLAHYLTIGEPAGLRPIFHFDPVFYRRQYNIPAETSCLGHYLANRLTGKFSPIAEFDVDYYTTQYPDVAAAGVDVFEHYLLYGYREGRDPSSGFRTRWYRHRYMPGDDGNPLIHFLRNRNEPGIHPSIPAGESTVLLQVRHFTGPGPHFEEGRPLPASARRRAKVLAYYLPQFHAFPENDEWWGKGFTEWTNVARGQPRFVGHYQPRIPRDLGFYTLTADVMRRQIEMAHGAGLSGFVFYFYWFNGQRLMERPLDMFLADRSLDFPFCLMWANENWTRRWDGSESDILIAQDYREADNAGLIDTFAAAFRDPRYIRLGGRPLLIIYRPGVIPKSRQAVATWRQMFRDRAGEDPIMVMSQSFGDSDPRPYGLDGAVEFPPHKLVSGLETRNQQISYLDFDLTAEVYDYDDIMAHSLDEPRPDFPLIKTLCPSWDNDARRQGTGLVVHGSTPAKYQQWLEALIAQSAAHPFFGERIVCVNAWNEWAEGAYLEPDVHFGSAYLNATARAVVGAAHQGSAMRLLLVGHDAFRAGSQLLLLNIGRRLAERYGFAIQFLLLDGGALKDAYAAVATTKVIASPQERARHFAELRAQGFAAAIVNTCAAAGTCEALAEAGFDCTLLVHEMPRILAEKGLWAAARTGIGLAARTIFAAPSIRDRILEGCELKDASTVILPQGSYAPKTYAPAARAALRSAWSIPPDGHLAIGVGYADLRKGFDLFLQAWRTARRTGAVVHFCWAGDIDPVVKTYLAPEIAQATETGTFHMPGFREDVGDLMSAADVFVLSSREDPYPTVVQEAISVGLPVIAFEGSGGIPELLRTHRAGLVVALGDSEALGRAVVDLACDPARATDRDRLIDLAKTAFCFDSYVERLCDVVLPQRLRISVVVPNYNYAHYLTSRLSSIFAQTYPLHEVIVLDDASTDDSVAVIRRVAAEWRRDIRVIANDRNSGSVFKQWCKAVEVATGDYIWLAEADDESEPSFVERLVEAIRQADGAGSGKTVMACSDGRAVDGEGALLWPDHKTYFASSAAAALDRDGVYPGPTFVRRFLAERNLILNVSGAIWLRSAFQQAIDRAGQRLLSYRLAGDWDLYVELLTVPDCLVAYVAEPLNVHRRHKGSVTHETDAVLHLHEMNRVHRLVRERLGKMAPVARQTRYLADVARQFGLSRSAAAKAKRGPERSQQTRHEPESLHAPGD